MTDAPNIASMSPDQAQARLAELSANKEWGRLVLEKQFGALAEFNALSARIAGVLPESADGGSTAARELTGTGADLFAPNAAEKLPPISTISGPHAMSPREQIGHIDHFRSQGLGDAEIKEILADGKYAPEAIAFAKNLLADRMSDKGWVERFQKGGAAEQRELTRLNAILSKAA